MNVDATIDATGSTMNATGSGSIHKYSWHCPCAALKADGAASEVLQADVLYYADTLLALGVGSEDTLTHVCRYCHTGRLAAQPLNLTIFVVALWRQC